MCSIITRKYQTFYLSSICFVCFSTFWLTSLLPISPIYIFFLGGLFFNSISYDMNINLGYKKIVVSFIYIFFMFLNNFLFCNEIKVYISYIFFLPYYFICDINLSKLSLQEIRKVVRIYLLFNCVLLLCDTVYRFLNGITKDFAPWMIANPHLIFYQFKEPALIYEDSNGTGIIALCVCGILHFVNYSKLNLFKNKICISLILYFSLFFTFSRAALLGFFCYMMYYIISKLKASLKILFIFLFFFCFCFLLVLFMQDNSFGTKMVIFNQTLEYIRNSNLHDLLLGHGQLSSSYVIKFGYAHNILSLYIIEYGVLNLFSFIIMMVIIVRDTGIKSSLCVLLPYLIAALSFSPIIIPYIFASLALIKHIQRVIYE